MKSRRLRIAQVSPLWTRVPPVSYGGIELLLKLLVDELVDQGHEVTLFASADCDVKGHLHSVLPICLSDMMGEQRAQCYEHYACAVMADAMARAHEFDILHFHLQPTWLPFAANAPCPSLFTLHTFPLLDDEWVMARYPNVEVAGISHYQIAQSSQRLGRKFPVVYNGCDFGAFEPRYEKGEYLAFLGRMSFQKNPGGAIQIACGTPVVGVRRGSVAEVVDSGITGFSAETVDELTPLVGAAIKLDRRTVRAHSEARFGFRQMVASYLSLYHELLDRKSSSS